MIYKSTVRGKWPLDSISEINRHGDFSPENALKEKKNR